jgi:hypothetical protein
MQRALPAFSAMSVLKTFETKRRSERSAEVTFSDNARFDADRQTGHDT